MPTTIRRAPENPAFRLVEREDLVPGAKFYKIDHDASDYEFQYPWELVVLDETPVVDRNGEPYVYYHCTLPAWEGQCFVPLSFFIARDELPEHDKYYASHYWIKI